MLKDLSTLRFEAIDKVQANIFNEISLSSTDKEKIYLEFIDYFTNLHTSLLSDSIKLVNKSKQTAYIPFSWFARLQQCVGFIEGLIEYLVVLDKVKNESGVDLKVFESLPSLIWRSKFSDDDLDKLYIFLSSNLSAEDISSFEDFLEGQSWLEVKNEEKGELQGRKLARRNDEIIASSVIKVCSLIQENSGKIELLIELLSEKPSLRKFLEKKNTIPDGEVLRNTTSIEDKAIFQYGSSADKGSNKIYYGAPGTGKSHCIDKITENHCRYVTVFHPDTQYSDLVGALKPVMVDANGEKKISYEFRPGPFTKALIEALNDTSKHVYLVIEELNRAPAAAVFGEIFQLLDRNLQGESRYKIEVSDPDMLLHIKENLKEPDKFNKLYLPANFSILATMNSSDQSVMPMDTAFKRRWLFEYLPIDFTKVGNGNFKFTLADGAQIEVPWKVFAEVVNDSLSSLQVPEDRLLGHRFVSDDELATIEEANNTLKGKILVYLWDDVLRHGKRDVIFNTSKVSTFGQLSHQFGEGEPIFSDTFEAQLLEALDKTKEVQETAANKQPE
ncbi:AAA family ATPase [Pseudoalteromonas sp. MMG022]|uniref:McrB family protein n=1 Tax=Pseudoalteromonas sp. MMG022 TaxID=2909978 RepID=UPI001F3828D5|nr:AAA family ATPase [Pseudoalteromonas sp. MMG022]MCF6437754.1 AAA family ATPase [Pseudoalteromonas sp. MMG022]